MKLPVVTSALALPLLAAPGQARDYCFNGDGGSDANDWRSIALPTRLRLEQAGTPEPARR